MVLISAGQVLLNRTSLFLYNWGQLFLVLSWETARELCCQGFDSLRCSKLTWKNYRYLCPTLIQAHSVTWYWVAIDWLAEWSKASASSVTHLSVVYNTCDQIQAWIFFSGATVLVITSLVIKTLLIKTFVIIVIKDDSSHNSHMGDTSPKRHLS